MEIITPEKLALRLSGHHVLMVELSVSSARGSRDVYHSTSPPCKEPRWKRWYLVSLSWLPLPVGLMIFSCFADFHCQELRLF